jgi:predicted alpha/beta superfamily hydrolase
MANQLRGGLALAVVVSLVGCSGSSSSGTSKVASTKPASSQAPASNTPPQPTSTKLVTSSYAPVLAKPAPVVSSTVVKAPPAPVASATPAPVVSATPPAPPAPPSFSFDVDAPTWTYGTVYVACDAPVNGAAWSANAIALTPDPALQNRWIGTMTVTSGTIAVTPGTVVNFKITRGTWGTVEKDPQGNDVPNRVAVCGSGPTTVFAHVFHWGDDSLYPPVTATRDLGLFTPRALALRREVYAHMPPGYDDPANANTDYPVLYCLDGQDLFDPTRSLTGKVIGMDVAADGNVTAGHGAFITIAIDSTFQRTNEYGPSYDPTVPGGGHLEDTAQFIISELKPEIDRVFRTKPAASSTGIFGTELGGLASFRLGWAHSDTLGLVASLSPLMGWNGEETKGIIGTAKTLPTLSIWLDVGTNEGTNPAAQLGFVRDADQALGLAAFPGTDLSYTEIAGGTADETSWGARLPQVLAYLFP